MILKNRWSARTSSFPIAVFCGTGARLGASFSKKKQEDHWILQYGVGFHVLVGGALLTA